MRVHIHTARHDGEWRKRNTIKRKNTIDAFEFNYSFGNNNNKIENSGNPRRLINSRFKESAPFECHINNRSFVFPSRSYSLIVSFVDCCYITSTRTRTHKRQKREKSEGNKKAMTIRFCLFSANKISQKNTTHARTPKTGKKATQTIEHHHNRRIFIWKFAHSAGRRTSEEGRRAWMLCQVIWKVNNLSIHRMATAQIESEEKLRRRMEENPEHFCYWSFHTIQLVVLNFQK